jgi:hypothetical protein
MFTLPSISAAYNREATNLLLSAEDEEELELATELYSAAARLELAWTLRFVHRSSSKARKVFESAHAALRHHSLGLLSQPEFERFCFRVAARQRQRKAH